MATYSEATQLAIQIAIGAAMVVSVSLIHSFGLLAILRLLPLGHRRLRNQSLDVKSIWLFGVLGLLLFLLHTVEIFLFAAVYMSIGAAHSLERSLDLSASAYATLGRGADELPAAWRLIVAVEALVGFVLISWSAALMATIMNRLRR